MRKCLSVGLAVVGFLAMLVAASTASERDGKKVAEWRGSKSEGDKPGFGLQVRRRDGDIEIVIFLMDPNKPHDFGAGRKFPTRTKLRTGNRYDVWTDAGQGFEYAGPIVFREIPKDQETIEAILETSDAAKSKTLILRRSKSK